MIKWKLLANVNHSAASLLIIAICSITAPAVNGEPTSAPTTQPTITLPQPVEPATQGAPHTWYNIHGQATTISEKHNEFHSPYSGQHSLQSHEPWRTSITGTLFMGLRLPWAGGEAYFDPEIAGGEGLSGVAGIAGFPNGEIPRVGSPEPQPYVGRLYFRQTFGFGGETEKVDDGPNQLAGVRDVSRLTVIAGKFGAVDFFQNSAYSNDPRSQFMNWALFTDGAWDYPADTRGYTEGVVIELNQQNWSLRYGAMAEPKTSTPWATRWNTNSDGLWTRIPVRSRSWDFSIDPTPASTAKRLPTPAQADLISLSLVHSATSTALASPPISRSPKTSAFSPASAGTTATPKHGPSPKSIAARRSA